jgi:hypothetical protein
MRNRARIVAIALALGGGLPAGAALAQTVYAFEDGRGLAETDCATIAARPTPPRAVCWPAGAAMRCAERLAAAPPEVCTPAGAAAGASLRALVASIGRDVSQGRRVAGGRFAAESACPVGVPQGELLLPEGTLRIDPAGATLSEVSVTDETGGAVVARFAALAAPATLPAEPLRGRTLAIAGSNAGRAFRCRASVLAAADAAPLIAGWRRLGSDGSFATALERAAFFRQADLAFEYWAALPAEAR